jgi:tetratricopeptide (TPR) repeat protein
MKKHVILSLSSLAVIVTFGIALTVPMRPLTAQDVQPTPTLIPIVCDAFTGESDEVRTSYYMGEAQGFVQSRDLAAAIISYRCITEQIDPAYSNAYMGRGLVYALRREYQRAIDDYTSAIGLDDSNWQAYNNRGIAYVGLTDYEAAMDDFMAADERAGDGRVPLNNRAMIHIINGEYEEAIALLEQALTESNIGDAVADLRDPERPADAPRPDYDPADAQSYALLGIVYSAYALDNYNDYLLLTGSQADARVQSAAGALESRFTFELRVQDGSFLLFGFVDLNS